MERQPTAGLREPYRTSTTSYWLQMVAGVVCWVAVLVKISKNIAAADFVREQSFLTHILKRAGRPRSQDYAAAGVSAAFSWGCPESRPLAATSRSTNSITATGALSP